MALHLLEGVKVLTYSFPLTVWTRFFTVPFTVVDMWDKSGYRHGTREISSQIVVFFLQIPLLLLRSSWFDVCAVLSGNVVFLSLPSDRFTWNLFHLSMDGIFIWVFFCQCCLSCQSPLCLYQLFPFKTGKHLIHWFLWFTSTVFCLYLSVMLESVGIHGVCVSYDSHHKYTPPDWPLHFDFYFFF